MQECVLKKSDVVKNILGDRYLQLPKNNFAEAFAPTNIALVKYWGKRNSEINLPVTSSLSISLADKGAKVLLSLHEKNRDEIFLNGKSVDADSKFSQRLIEFLNLFRNDGVNANGGQTPAAHHGRVRPQHLLVPALRIEIHSNIPIAAGLASSACGFASITKALNKLYGWNLSEKHLSVLARLGSGSASRSIWNGFVEWHQGVKENGEDSHGELIKTEWSELRVGLLIMNANEKKISSREAMQKTIETSPLYFSWPQKVSEDLSKIKFAIQHKDFNLLGETAESNALAMHATMNASTPAIDFCDTETYAAREVTWQLRKNNLPIYFTQDAGPNLKLLFLEKNICDVKKYFPQIEIIKPF